MYNEYFGLKECPFSIVPDPRYLYLSEQHREALAHLVYGFNSEGGFVLLTGEVGTGKTTVCRCLLEQIPENSAIAFILNSKLTVDELLATICDEFGIKYPDNNQSLKLYIDNINRFLLEAHSRGSKAVLIIDEAQNLSAEVLEQLRLLTNLETTQHKLLQIILLGQPELRDKLSRPELRQLSQRIIARYHLGPLSKEDMGAYLSHRLSVAGVREKLFPEALLNRLYKLTGGVPRLINVICDRALLGTYTQGNDIVSKTTLESAAKEIFGTSKLDIQGRQSNAAMWKVTALIFLAIGAVLAAIYFNTNGPGQVFKETVEGADITANAFMNESSAKLNPPAAQPVLLDKLEWSSEQQIARSEDIAFQALLKLWDLDYDAKGNTSACNYAKVHGLLCASRRGNLRSLFFLNRPSILRLFDKQGHSFFMTLTALNDKTGTFTVGAKSITVSVRDIESLWFGDFTILWRPPPGYEGNIHPGNKNPVVPWLDKQLALIQDRHEQEKNDTLYDDILVNQVKAFQISEGLIPDGVVGIQTFLSINSMAGFSSPKLITEQNRNN